MNTDTPTRTCRACGGSLAATPYEYWLGHRCTYCAFDELRGCDVGLSLAGLFAANRRNGGHR